MYMYMTHVNSVYLKTLLTNDIMIIHVSMYFGTNMYCKLTVMSPDADHTKIVSGIPERNVMVY
jgi:hypothetical protein